MPLSFPKSVIGTFHRSAVGTGFPLHQREAERATRAAMGAAHPRAPPPAGPAPPASAFASDYASGGGAFLAGDLVGLVWDELGFALRPAVPLRAAVDSDSGRGPGSDGFVFRVCPSGLPGPWLVSVQQGLLPDPSLGRARPGGSTSLLA